MTFQRYMEKVGEYILDYPDWRYGQTLYNVLSMFRPDLAYEIQLTGLDPYYKNPTEVAPFLEWVAARWEG